MKPRPRKPPNGHKLALLLGRWNIEVTASGKGRQPVAGSVIFYWLAPDQIMIMQGQTPGGPPNFVAVMSADDSTKAFCMLHTDERGAARQYAMTITQKAWTLKQRSNGLSRRFIGLINRDKTVIEAQWQKSRDGRRWMHESKITYTRS